METLVSKVDELLRVQAAQEKRMRELQAKIDEMAATLNTLDANVRKIKKEVPYAYSTMYKL